MYYYDKYLKLTVSNQYDKLRGNGVVTFWNYLTAGIIVAGMVMVVLFCDQNLKAMMNNQTNN
jgi:hypothetical protein